MYFKIQNKPKKPEKTKVRAMNEQNCANDRERFTLLIVSVFFFGYTLSVGVLYE